MNQELIQILKSRQNGTSVKVWSQQFSGAMASLRVRTMDDIAALTTQKRFDTTLSVIAKQNGEQVVMDFIRLSIADFLEFLSLPDNNSMGVNQINQTAELILDDSSFRCLMIEDYKLFFKQAKKGFYGQLYGRIDGQTIITWLGQYFEERCKFFSRQSENEAHVTSSGYTKAEAQKFIQQLATERKRIENEKQADLKPSNHGSKQTLTKRKKIDE